MHDGDPSLLRTPSGVVRGRVDRTAGLVRFSGVPYAAAPFGDLRFQPPAPHPGWEGVRDALEPGPTPLLPPMSETSSIPEPPTPGEEILNLNITAPIGAKAPLPVYVWIHGGGYVSGSPNGGWFDGATLARSGVVVVSLTYRLGFEGFGHIPDAPDNRAVLDCLAALRWVRDTVAEVGGDPQRVTVGGQSAGGGLVLALLTAPPARDLFRAAVVHSAPLPDISPHDAERLSARLADQLAVTSHDVAGWREISREHIVAAERGLELGSVWSSLQALRDALSRRGPLTALGPIVGTEVVPDVFAALAEPDPRPVLIGTTAAEFNPATTELERVLGTVTPRPVLSAVGLPAALARAYPRAHPGWSASQLLGQALTDRAFRTGALQVARARAAAGTPAALWDFRWHPDGGPARHCIDLPFAWDVLDGERVDRIAGDDPPSSLATEMSGDIAAFVHDGVVGWPGWTPEAPVAKVYDTPSWVGRDPYRFERIALELL